MRAAALLDKTAAVARRDLLTAIRYRTGFMITALGTVAELAAFYYLARAVGPSFRPEGVEYFPFVLVGTGLYTFLLTGMNAFLMTVQQAQQTGTLEVLVTTATPAPVLLFLSALSAFAGATVQLIFYLGAGMLCFDTTFHPNLAGCALVFALSAVIAVSFGLFAAGLQVAIQKGSALVWLLGSGAWFLTGTLFPVGTLPKPLWWVAQLIPVTHALNGMRLALLEGAGLRALSHELAILALFSIFLLPASVVVFSYTLKRARMDGTLSFY